MITEEQLLQWIEADHSLIEDLKNLMLEGEKGRIRYAHESSERMKELNKMMSNEFQGNVEYKKTLNKQLEVYIKLLDKALLSLDKTQNSLNESLSALSHAQKENDRLNAQVETLQQIIKNMTSAKSAGVEINNHAS